MRMCQWQTYLHRLGLSYGHFDPFDLSEETFVFISVIQSTSLQQIVIKSLSITKWLDRHAHEFGRCGNLRICIVRKPRKIARHIYMMHRVGNIHTIFLNDATPFNKQPLLLLLLLRENDTQERQEKRNRKGFHHQFVSAAGTRGVRN